VNLRVRHLISKPSGYYFQATAAMRAAGIASEPLGTDLAAAAARADELNAAWDAIRAGAATDAPARGTVAHLVAELRRSSEYADKKPRTLEELEYALDVVVAVFGPTHVRAVRAYHCRDFYDALRRQGSLHRAAKIMKWLRYLFNFALRMEYGRVRSNPAAAVRVRKPPPRRTVWTEDQVEAAIARGNRDGLPGAAVAIAIAYDTSLRACDVRVLTCGQFDGRSLWLVQAKTGLPQRVPLWPETVHAIRAYRATLDVGAHPEAPLIMTPTGRPYSPHHLARHVRQVLRGAGIPDDIRFSDLRRTASKERAEAGASAAQLAAATGHSIARGVEILDVYNPPSYALAKGAQDKRRRRKKRNRTGTKV